MYYRIDTITIERKTQSLYVVASFWRNEDDFNNLPAQFVNDFVINVEPTKAVPITDDQGRWKRKSDGRFIDVSAIDADDEQLNINNWETKIVNTDTPAIIRNALSNYYRRANANNYPRHNTSEIETTDNDMRQMLTEDILDMRNENRDTR